MPFTSVLRYVIAVMTFLLLSSSGRVHITHGVEDYVDDFSGRRDHRRVVHLARAGAGAHPLGHEALRIRGDHAVLLGDQEPARAVLPQRPLDRHADTVGAEWALHCG